MEKRYAHTLLFGKQYQVDIYSTACGEHVKCHLYYPEVKELKEENSITEKLLDDCDEAVRGKDRSRQSYEISVRRLLLTEIYLRKTK